MKSITRILALLLLTAVLLTGAALADGADAVYDWDDILTDSEEAALTGAAEEVAAKYDVGVYIAVLPDMEDYGFYDIEACAEAFYTDMELGVGAEKTGILLILSMAERDYDLCAYGSFGHYAFTDYGKTTISDEFLDNFRRNDWYGGFERIRSNPASVKAEKPSETAVLTPGTPFRAALRAATSTASGSMSDSMTFASPQIRAATMPTRPQPQPRSSTLMPGSKCARDSMASVPRSACRGENRPGRVSSSSR